MNVSVPLVLPNDVVECCRLTWKRLVSAAYSCRTQTDQQVIVGSISPQNYWVAAIPGAVKILEGKEMMHSLVSLSLN